MKKTQTLKDLALEGGLLQNSGVKKKLLSRGLT